MLAAERHALAAERDVLTAEKHVQAAETMANWRKVSTKQQNAWPSGETPCQATRVKRLIGCPRENAQSERKSNLAI
ncbi:hypothetical protein AMS59_10755 [Lysinibacillus sp. FJAT-14745]|nr:hypothetical protein AMS59_10755 [Lysinibacillus sp. FJAT-14745]